MPFLGVSARVVSAVQDGDPARFLGIEVGFRRIGRDPPWLDQARDRLAPFTFYGVAGFTPKFSISLRSVGFPGVLLWRRGRPIARRVERVAIAGLNRDIEPDSVHAAREARHHLAAQRRQDARRLEPANRLTHRLDA